jgi:hypothetical protein
MTFSNIIYIVFGLYLYVVALYPILEDAIIVRIMAEQANPQVWTDPVCTILGIIPIAIPIGIIATIFIYSQPRVQQ